MSLALITWFYQGLGGLGGWALFAGGGVSAAVWVLADSIRRSLPAHRERVELLLALLLSTPAAVLHFGSAQSALQQLSSQNEIALGLALLGGLGALAMAAWYGYRYRGLVACRYGHQPYPAEMGRCPECAFHDAAVRRGLPEPAHSASDPRIHVNPPGRHAVRADAWLISPRGRRFQLYQGENRLGRDRAMHFIFTGDQAVSAYHARITERDSQFYLMDHNSRNGTWLNGRRLEPFAEAELVSGDVIALSDATQVEFVARDGEG